MENTLSPTQDAAVVAALNRTIGAWGTNVGKVARAIDTPSVFASSYATAVAGGAAAVDAIAENDSAAKPAAVDAIAETDSAAKPAADAAPAAKPAAIAETDSAAKPAAKPAAVAAPAAKPAKTNVVVEPVGSSDIKRYASFETISMTPSTVFKLKFMRKPLTLPTAESNGKRYVMAHPLAEALLDTNERKTANRFITRLSPVTGAALQDFVKRWKMHEDDDDIMMVRSDGLWSFLVSIMPTHKNVTKKMRTDLFDMVMEQITCDTTEPKKRKSDDADAGRKKADDTCDTPKKRKSDDIGDDADVGRKKAGDRANNDLVMHEAIFNARSQLYAQEQAARKEALNDLKREEEVRAAARASRLADLREELRIRTALAAVGDSAMF